MIHRVLSDHGHRRAFAAADARHALHAHRRAENSAEFFHQRIRTMHRTGERIADAHSELRRYCRAGFDDIEMMVEAGHLEDFRQRDFQLGGQRCEQRFGQAAAHILNAMQILDQALADERCGTQQGMEFGPRGSVDAIPVVAAEWFHSECLI